MSDELAAIVKRLEKYPHMIARITAILDVAENTSGDLELANDAEYKVLEEIKKMGNETLTIWGKTQESRKRKIYEKKDGAVKHDKKKHIGKLG